MVFPRIKSFVKQHEGIISGGTMLCYVLVIPTMFWGSIHMFNFLENTFPLPREKKV